MFFTRHVPSTVVMFDLYTNRDEAELSNKTRLPTTLKAELIQNCLKENYKL